MELSMLKPRQTGIGWSFCILVPFLLGQELEVIVFFCFNLKFFLIGVKFTQVKSTILKYTIHQYLANLQCCVTIISIQFRSIFITPSKRNPITIKQSLPIPLPPPQVILCLATCTQHHVFQAYLHCSMYQYLDHSYGCTVFYCMDIPNFTYPFFC